MNSPTGFVLLAFALPLPLIAAIVPVVRLIVAAFTRRLLPARRAAKWGQGAGLLLCLAVLCYSTGLWTGGLLDLSAASEQCPAGPLTTPALRQSLLPLRNSCNYAGGTTVNQVPALVNPVLFVLLAATLFCLAMTIVTARRGTPQKTGSTS